MNLKQFLHLLLTYLTVLLLHLLQILCPLWYLLSTLVQPHPWLLLRTVHYQRIFLQHLPVLIIVYQSQRKPLFLIVKFFLVLVGGLVGGVVGEGVARERVLIFLLRYRVFGEGFVEKGEDVIAGLLGLLGEFGFLRVGVFDVFLVVEVGEKVGVLLGTIFFNIG